MGGGKQSQTTTQTAEPFNGEYKPWVYPVKDYVFGKLQNGAEKYGGQLNYGATDNQKYAFNQFRQAADNPMLQDTLSGKYLNPESNPYIQKTYDLASQNVLKGLNKANDAVNSQFSHGLWNSSARRSTMQNQANQAGETLAGLANQIYSGNYNQERGYQLQAVGAQQQLLGNLLNAGTAEQAAGQSDLDRNYKEWLRQMGVDDSNLDRALNFLQVVKNPTTTQTTTQGGGK